MDRRSEQLIERWGPQRARHVVLVLALLSLLLILAVAALLIVDALHTGRLLPAAGIALLGLIALVFWARLLRNRWETLRVQHFDAGVGTEETGVWGVGGPGMRTPGATGIYPPFQNRRQSEHDRREDQRPL